jgi:hypothetical protein
MTTNSDIGKHLEAVAARLAAVSGVTWTTAPAAAWFPDWDRAELGDTGLTALVLPVQQPLEMETRGAIDGDLATHVAVIKPITTTRNQLWADGDGVVTATRLVAADLLGRVVGDWVCLAADHSPIISREAAKTYNLWISYLTTTWKKAK